jgi:flagellin
MAMSVQTNQAALLALQNLNKTNDQLTETQSRISTGLAITNAKDNASVWAIAQGQRSDIGALGAVKASLDRAASISDVALSAGESVSDLLNQIKAKVVAAKDSSLDPSARAAMNNDFQALLRQISNVVRNAEFDGANILNNSLTANLRFLANADANAYLTLSVKNMTLSGPIISITTTATISTVTNANNVLTDVENSIAAVNSALGDLGSQGRQVEAHRTFVTKLSDVLETGLGNLVDADLAREGARLQALQVQQQLGVQALGIANSGPQVILSLFKGG